MSSELITVVFFCGHVIETLAPSAMHYTYTESRGIYVHS